jgi:ribonuclease R
LPRNIRRQTTRGANKQASTKLPDKSEILAFVQDSPERVGKREIARAFNIKGSQRIELKRLLKEMADDGLIEGTRKALSQPGILPSVCVIEIAELDENGEPVAVQAGRTTNQSESPARIRVLAGRGPTAGLGDRVLARLNRLHEADFAGCTYEARPIKVLPRDRERLLGIYRTLKGGGGLIVPVDRKQRKEWRVSAENDLEARSGELVRFELDRRGRYALSQARILERLGNPKAERAISLIAIHAHGIPDQFQANLLQEAEALKPSGLGKRKDLRDLPLITIDPPDARDHDDAVWAAPDQNQSNKGGWIVIVAIADVAHYVQPGSALDREALRRGNSVYFPDRVVPMLPERISSDLGSLIGDTDRPCLALRMTFDHEGHKKHQEFFRGLMRSAATLSYEQVQAAIDGRPDEQTAPLLEGVLMPLWGAFEALKLGQARRKPLELDLPERKIMVDENGDVVDIVVPPRLEANRLIEEFMIQANVAAAETLEAKRSPLIYRVHDNPSAEKLSALSDVLTTMGIKLPKTGALRPHHFNRILEQTRDSEAAILVSAMILRSQAQAEYSPANYGHFGLNLRRYAHFTSPIRRYADLIVHRGLIRALGLGEGGLTDAEIDHLDTISEAISATERRAMASERETTDRLVAAYLAGQIGATFDARISGTTRVGLFVRLDRTGADGFVPASAIGTEFFVYDEARHRMVGERTGQEYRLGDRVEVRLVEAIPEAGALRFELLSDGRPGKPPSGHRNHRPKSPKRTKSRRRR